MTRPTRLSEPLSGNALIRALENYGSDEEYHDHLEQYGDDISNEGDLEDAIWDKLTDCPGVTSVRTFRDMGILTGNRGLVVATESGEYQVTITKSK